MRPEDLAKMARGNVPPANAAPQEQQIPISPEDLEDVTCKACGSVYFDVALLVKRLSPLHPKNVMREEHFFPARVLVCKKCGVQLDGVVL